MELRLATEADRKELYFLWNEAFGDGNDTIDLFFDTALKFENVPVIADEGKILSVLYLIETEIVNSTSSHSAYYIYAAATRKSHRQKGLMAELLEYSARLAGERNIDYLFLCPETEKLYNYYEKQGFKTAFYKSAEVEKYDGEEISPYSFVNWNEAMVMLDCGFQGSDFYKCKFGFAQIEKTAHHILVKYFVSGQANEFLDEIKKDFPDKSLLVCLPSDSGGKKTGMIRKISDTAPEIRSAYMGLTME